MGKIKNLLPDMQVDWDEVVIPTRDPATYDRTFAARMKRERLRRGWRQEDLARELAKRKLDLHPSAIAKIEREPDPKKGIEPRAIRVGEAMVIARVFEKSVEEMLSDDDLTDYGQELDRLADEVVYARKARQAAHMALTTATMDMEIANDRLAQLEARMEEVRRRAPRVLVPPDANLDTLRTGEVREFFEEFIAYWFSQTRDDLIEHGWSRSSAAPENDPQALLKSVSVAITVFPDLEPVGTEVYRKLQDDIEWWNREGAGRHDDRMRELVAEMNQERDHEQWEAQGRP
ncbi:helix-turn-helix transcriptional regulator [Dactylosporangium sp. AC04546]|uniref:helix-turn-helix transcriptional regulator n=1 Tax=Dactylosporangium sp. AC04546 TaxID=2862460 RepID=UPI001EE07B41|nr:helix-turn-helix transcriptional regulator [Dactylosporangium sp. AC04546]WVK78904.1 helix-turn-helix transcriptional regulator [Dactylosporangium sp. AC04546]